jgi:FKBP-type peptidyl-prolyl cis-trans isomerase
MKNSSLRTAAHHATSLAKASQTPTKKVEHPRKAKRPIPEAVVAQVKKDLRTMSIKTVAEKHGLKVSAVKGIDDGLNYKDVKEGRENSPNADGSDRTSD